MSEFTKGPWFVHGPNIGPRLQGEHGIPIMVARIAGDQGDDECAANARLISAAPEMLEALEIARMGIIAIADSAIESGFGELADTFDGLLTKANAAIAKARGAA